MLGPQMCECPIYSSTAGNLNPCCSEKGFSIFLLCFFLVASFQQRRHNRLTSLFGNAQPSEDTPSLIPGIDKLRGLMRFQQTGNSGTGSRLIKSPTWRQLVAKYFDDRFIVSVILSSKSVANICCFQPLKCEDFAAFLLHVMTANEESLRGFLDCWLNKKKAILKMSLWVLWRASLFRPDNESTNCEK